MTDRELIQMALDALEKIHYDPKSLWNCREEIETLRARLAQVEQEPVAWMNPDTPMGVFARHKEGADNFKCTVPLYTAPQQRPWQGLTDEEMRLIRSAFHDSLDTNAYCRAIEKKLKEKNT